MKKKKLSEKQTKMMQRKRKESRCKFSEIKRGQVIIHRGKHVVCQVDSKNYDVFFNKAFTLNVGDFISFGLETKNSKGQLIELEDRRNLLYRHSMHGQRKELAANIDCAFVMLACQPEFYPEVLSQYYTILAMQGIPCCFILNKIDLVSQGEIPYKERFEYFLETDLAQTLAISCYNDKDLAKAKELMSGKTSLVLGPSGAGKSSFVQKITENANIKIGELSEAGVGCHTTSVTKMYHVGEETRLIDSPGIRQMSVDVLTLEELKKGFPEFKNYGCRYRNCDHIQTDGCQVKEDEMMGQHFRYQDYCFLYQKFVVKNKDG